MKFDITLKNKTSLPLIHGILDLAPFRNKQALQAQPPCTTDILLAIKVQVQVQDWRYSWKGTGDFHMLLYNFTVNCLRTTTAIQRG